MASSRPSVVIDSGAAVFTVSLIRRLAVAGVDCESLTSTVKLLVPWPVGVP